jgi:hypothetical protein
MRDMVKFCLFLYQLTSFANWAISKDFVHFFISFISYSPSSSRKISLNACRRVFIKFPFFIFAFVGTVSCVEEKVKLIDVTSYKPLPQDIQTADKSIQKFSSATAMVLGINGTSGSGFFISPDGLFVTNEHVLSRDSCEYSGCPGYIIIRDYHKSGKKQIYKKYQVVLHSTDLDFTLIKVNLPRGESVPFIPLAKKSSSLPSVAYILGHPKGTYLSWLRVSDLTKYEDELSALGEVFSGNSGGVVLDPTSNSALGIVSSRSTISISKGTHRADNQTSWLATTSDAIVAALSNQFQTDFEKSPLMAKNLNLYVEVPYENLKTPQPIIVPSFSSEFHLFSGSLFDYDKMNRIHQFLKGVGARTLLVKKSFESLDSLNIAPYLLIQNLGFAADVDLSFSTKQEDLFKKSLLQEEIDYTFLLEAPHNYILNTLNGFKNLSFDDRKSCLLFYKKVVSTALSQNLSHDDFKAITLMLPLFCREFIYEKAFLNRFFETFDWTLSRTTDRAFFFGYFSFFIEFIALKNKSDTHTFKQFLVRLYKSEPTSDLKLKIKAMIQNLDEGFWRNQKFKDSL